MNAVAEKWRVTFTPDPPAGSVACDPPDDGTAEHWRDNSGILSACGYLAEGYGWMDLLGTAKFRLDHSKREVTAFPLPGVSPDRLYDAYCHAALPVALHFFGGEVLHASAVQTAESVVAFCAISETGKSTLAGALSARGYRLWADDTVAFDPDDASHGSAPIRTMLLPFTLRPQRPSVRSLGEEDRLVGKQASGAFPLRPLAALCVLERSNRSQPDVELRRLSPSEAFTALLPHGFYFNLRDPARKRAMFEFYLKMVARTPVFALSFVPGFERLPAILDAIEATVPGFAARYATSGKLRRVVMANEL